MEIDVLKAELALAPVLYWPLQANGRFAPSFCYDLKNALLRYRSSRSRGMNNAPARDALDDKANRLFSGKVVRKDLVRKVKTGAHVPFGWMIFISPETVFFTALRSRVTVEPGKPLNVAFLLTG
jgi:hypothetical protein